MDTKRLITDLSKVCEYMYRKGLYDSGCSGDPAEIREITERDDILTTYKVMNKTEINEKNHSIFVDELVVISNKLRAQEWREFMIYAKRSNAIKKEMLTLIDQYYMDGLKDGLTISKDECIDLYESVKYGAVHYCVKRKTILNRNEFIDDMKSKCNNINIQKKNMGMKCYSYSLLSRLIEDGRR